MRNGNPYDSKKIPDVFAIEEPPPQCCESHQVILAGKGVVGPGRWILRRPRHGLIALQAPDCVHDETRLVDKVKGCATARSAPFDCHTRSFNDATHINAGTVDPMERTTDLRVPVQQRPEGRENTSILRQEARVKIEDAAWRNGQGFTLQDLTKADGDEQIRSRILQHLQARRIPQAGQYPHRNPKALLQFCKTESMPAAELVARSA